ncbi:hypothetical protein D0Z00_000811 [Geotrichum galactomycetum]|uniref:Uncharacterized protein n=1 Tax=Geotrichum galactomycetum TaxID=27317 RepID=A0ACB6V8S1_9ASCO|nr:hypothetical protein D0Z00_000811 [Geotrichum candidum]
MALPDYNKDKYAFSNNSPSDWTALDYAYDFINFLQNNPTEFHATQHIRQVLDQAGFKYISERANWTNVVSAAGKFYTVRNGSSLVAFEIGAKWNPKVNGIAMVGAHIDAITAKLKPISIVSTSDEGEGGYLRIGVAPYSGALSPQWWDRDLGLGGRLIVRDSATANKAQSIKSVLVKLDHPIGRIPTLAPHFGAVANGPFNKETQMVPIIGLQTEVEPATEKEKESPVYGKHDLRLLRAIAKQAGVALEDVLEVELQLYDSQPGTLGGLDREFLIAGRLDDKLCSYAALYGLIESEGADPHGFNVVALFDNEEVGSLTKQGARGGLLEAVLDRVLESTGEVSLKRQVLANSFFVSADTTHAVNPNFRDQYLEHHKPKLNHGVTIKYNVNMANTTDAVSSVLVQEIARRTGNKLQYFHIRNDSRSGGTIGPAVSAALGVRAIDVGIPQLSMHSIRATTGTRDVYLGVKFFRAIFEQFGTVDNDLANGGL